MSVTQPARRRGMNARARDLIARHPALGLIGSTPLVRLDLFDQEIDGATIHAKAEFMNPGGSIKDRAVLRMLAEAVASGELREGRTILDSSSGNAGIAYAMIGRPGGPGGWPRGFGGDDPVRHR